MTCTQALLSLFLLAPCEDGGSGGHESITAAVANPSRPEADVARDENRKPAAILSFFEIEPGMTVLDVFAGGGFYTEILDSVVGEAGKVLSHNNQAYLDFVGEQLKARFTDGGLPNVELITAEINAVELKENSLDAALMILAYHDFFYSQEQYNWPDADESAFLESLCAAMKPGAVLGVIDHVANPGDDITEVAFSLHRIDPARVMEDMTSSCFEFKGESSVLRNSLDDHSLPMNDPTIRGKTDRFVYKFVRK